MLVLTRRAGEAVTIETTDGTITVHYLGSRGNDQARIGFDAPRHIKILRDDAKTKEPKDYATE